MCVQPSPCIMAIMLLHSVTRLPSLCVPGVGRRRAKRMRSRSCTCTCAMSTSLQRTKAYVCTLEVASALFRLHVLRKHVFRTCISIYVFNVNPIRSVHAYSSMRRPECTCAMFFLSRSRSDWASNHVYDKKSMANNETKNNNFK